MVNCTISKHIDSLTKDTSPLYSYMKKHDVKGLDISLMRPFIEGLLKNMEGGVFTVDLDKRILSFNKGAEWITGYLSLIHI